MERMGHRMRMRQMSDNQREAWDDLNREVEEASSLRDAYRILPRLPIRIVACALGKAINQGGILRLAEAFRAERVFYECEASGFTDMAGGAGVWDWQPYEFADPLTVIQQSKTDGYEVVGVTASQQSVPIQAHHWRMPTVLVFGQERDGLDQEIADACDVHVAIPLLGLIPSINVASAAAIALYEASTACLLAHPEINAMRPLSKDLIKQIRESD